MKKISLLIIALITLISIQSTQAAFDHQSFDKILKQYVKDGLVDYKGLKENRAPLDAYLAKLGSADLSSANREEKLAFYINAYNAITFKRIIDHYPVESIKDIPGVWKRTKDNVAGQRLTLDAIEHEILRHMNEPRIHFAIVCASGGCPIIQDFAFTAEELEAQLDKSTKDFFLDASKNKIDVANKTIYLSKIFNWFGSDFKGVYTSDSKLIDTYGAKNGSILNLYAKYNPEGVKAAKASRFKVDYNHYGWELNEE